MFRTISVLGLGVVCLVLSLIVGLLDVRIAVDESWKVEKVVLVSFLAVVGLCLVVVAIGRRREAREQKAIAAEDRRMLTPR